MKYLIGLLGSVALLSSCAGYEAEGDEAAAGEQSQAFTSGEVFGFENLALWSVSSGTKQHVTPATEGSKALGVSGFSYTSITSQVVHQLSGVSSELALDVKLPSAASWGDVRIILRAPSKGIWYADLGTKALNTLGSGSYRTLKFAVPAAIRTALEANPTDLRVEIAVNGPGFSAPVAFDNLRFTGAPPTPSSVIEIRAPLVDDFAFLRVNGVMHRVGYWGQPDGSAWRDVSSWFAGGTNQVRFFAMNDGGPQGLEFELRLNGTTVYSVNCAVDGCETRGGGVFVDQVINLPQLSLPPARTVSVAGPSGGKLYLNDDFTGLSTPATLTLPAGSYRLGLGVSTDTPGAYTGTFYEKSVVVGGQNVSLTLGDQPALGVQDTTRIAILPIRRARALDSGGLAILQDADISRFASQFARTRDAWVKPFSYGLTTWNITVLPVEEQLEMVGDTFQSFPDHACPMLDLPKYQTLLSQYDVVMMFYSNYDAQLGREIGRGDAGMGGRCGQIQDHVGRDLGASNPNPVILHEMLHSSEAHHSSVLHRYNGVDGNHGAEEHGYPENTSDGEIHYVHWYRQFMRGQVPERADAVAGVTIPTIVQNPDYFVGPFATFRRGGW
jgi:hypothetical protein